MVRRLGMVLLAATLALGGLASTACARASCAQMTRARMRCCPVQGVHQARHCCDGRLNQAVPVPDGALERAPQAPAPLALPVRMPVPAGVLAAHAAVPVLAPPGLGPPESLLHQHTSLLL
jgi:hypothetical protein